MLGSAGATISPRGQLLSDMGWFASLMHTRMKALQGEGHTPSLSQQTQQEFVASRSTGGLRVNDWNRIVRVKSAPTPTIDT